jgi:hypothetical protein
MIKMNRKYKNGVVCDWIIFFIFVIGRVVNMLGVFINV